MFHTQTLLRFDQAFTSPYQLLRYTYGMVRKCYAVGTKSGNRVVVLKIMGLSSIIRIASIWEQNQVDWEKIRLCTFSRNKEICEILGFKRTIYIRDQNLVVFLVDIFRAWWGIRQFQPQYVLDLGRYSCMVGAFRMVCGILANCKTLSLSNYQTDIAGKNDWEWSLKEHTYGEAIQQTTAFLSKTNPLPESQPFRWESLVCSHKILININAGSCVPDNRYPIFQFVRLIQALDAKPTPYTFYLTGSAAEHQYVQWLEDVLQELGIDAHNVAGLWSLRELVYQLSDCRVFITNDSGPLHLANYLQIPTVALWGPTHYRYFGYENNPFTRHLSLEMPCSPCFTDSTSRVGEACAGKIYCMKNLDPERIAKIIEQFALHQPVYRSWVVPHGLVPQHSSQRIPL